MPDFTLKSRPPNDFITEAEWWLWQEFHEFEPRAQLGGIYANKSGFHNTGDANIARWPTNYSIRDSVNRTGPWWRKYASAIDFTFPDAQGGDYSTIDRYTSRLMSSSRNGADPRLDLILFEFYGQDDNDLKVEGWNEYREEAVTSDSSHLWHIHISFLRSKCGDFWSMWALLTVLMGWSVERWRDSLPKPPEEEEDVKPFFIKIEGNAATWLSDGMQRRSVDTYAGMKEMANFYGIPLSAKEVPDEASLNRLGGVLIEPNATQE